MKRQIRVGMAVGAGVLAWTAASMICHEPAVERFLGEQPWMRYAIYVVILGGVLGGGYWMKTRKR